MKNTPTSSISHFPETTSPKVQTSTEETLTFSQARQQYLRHLKSVGRAPSTRLSYDRCLNQLEQYLPHRILLHHVTRELLTDSLLALEAESSLPSPRSAVTMNRIRSCYRTFFRWATAAELLPSDPALWLTLARAESPPTPAMGQLDFEKLLQTISNSPDPLAHRDGILFQLYGYAGLRRSEALQLRVNDYDPSGNTVHVRQGKGRQPRRLPLSISLGAQLNHWVAQIHSAPASRQWLFSGPTGRDPLTDRQVNLRFALWRLRADLAPTFTIRSLRAGFATTLYAASHDLVMVSRALGHRDLRPTLRYLDPSAAALRLAIQSAFGSKSSDIPFRERTTSKQTTR